MDTHGLYPAFFAWLSENGLDAFALSTNQLLIYLEKFCCENKGKIELTAETLDGKIDSEVNALDGSKLDKYDGTVTAATPRVYLSYTNPLGDKRDGALPVNMVHFGVDNATGLSVKDYNEIVKYPDTAELSIPAGLKRFGFNYHFNLKFSEDFDVDLDENVISLAGGGTSFYQHSVSHNNGQNAFGFVSSDSTPVTNAEELLTLIRPGAAMVATGSTGILHYGEYVGSNYIFHDYSGFATATIPDDAELTDIVTQI